MICALLILQEPELPLPLDTLSPWIDMVTRARTEVFADLEAQTHRRCIETCTPLDGIPSDRRSRNLRRAGPARRGAVDGPPYRQHRHRRVPQPARTGGRDRRYRARAIAAAAAAPRRRAGPLLAVGRRPDAVDAGRVVAAATVEHLQTFRTPPAISTSVCALRRPQGRPGGADAADGRAPRHRRRRAPMAPPGPGGDVRVDAQQGRHDRPRRWSGALDRSRRVLQPGTSGQWHDLLDDAGLAPYAARVRALASGPSSSGCIASRSTEIPVRRYTRTTQS